MAIWKWSFNVSVVMGKLYGYAILGLLWGMICNALWGLV